MKEWILALSARTGSPRPQQQSLLRNNRPLLAYLAGKTAAFTSKDHNFVPGEPWKSRVIVINNSRQPVQLRLRMDVGFASTSEGQQRVTVATDNRKDFRALRVTGHTSTRFL
jgi:hypothetical protein